jgi:antitoxin component YwqK of YwqJK toxin-antitoxin module
MSEINNNYCGVIRTYHDNLKVMLYEEYFINAGKKEGIYKLYWENGQLGKEINYIDGLKQGIFKSYHYNGQLSEEVNYIVCFYKTGIGII